MDHLDKSNQALNRTHRKDLWRSLLWACVALVHIGCTYSSQYWPANKTRSAPTQRRIASVRDATRWQPQTFPQSVPCAAKIHLCPKLSIHAMGLDERSQSVNYVLMRHSKILRTPDDVVAAFGGAKAAADWAGIGVSAVSNWTARGFIPPGWHYRMHQHFAEQGVLLDGTVFGQRNDRPTPRHDRCVA